MVFSGVSVTHCCHVWQARLSLLPVLSIPCKDPIMKQTKTVQLAVLCCTNHHCVSSYLLIKDSRAPTLHMSSFLWNHFLPLQALAGPTFSGFQPRKATPTSGCLSTLSGPAFLESPHWTPTTSTSLILPSALSLGAGTWQVKFDVLPLNCSH